MLHPEDIRVQLQQVPCCSNMLSASCNAAHSAEKRGRSHSVNACQQLQQGYDRPHLLVSFESKLLPAHQHNVDVHRYDVAHHTHCAGPHHCVYLLGGRGHQKGHRKAATCVRATTTMCMRMWAGQHTPGHTGRLASCLQEAKPLLPGVEPGIFGSIDRRVVTP